MPGHKHTSIIATSLPAGAKSLPPAVLEAFRHRQSADRTIVLDDDCRAPCRFTGRLGLASGRYANPTRNPLADLGRLANAGASFAIAGCGLVTLLPHRNNWRWFAALVVLLDCCLTGSQAAALSGASPGVVMAVLEGLTSGIVRLILTFMINCLQAGLRWIFAPTLRVVLIPEAYC